MMGRNVYNRSVKETRIKTICTTQSQVYKIYNTFAKKKTGRKNVNNDYP